MLFGVLGHLCGAREHAIIGGMYVRGTRTSNIIDLFRGSLIINN